MCPCAFQNLSALGAGNLQAYQQNVQALQAVALTEVPDTAFQQVCQTECCECAESAEAAIAVQAKNRTFTISGSISVLEEVEYAQRQRAAEQSIGKSEKKQVCETNQASNGGVGLGCAQLSLCPEGLGAGQNQSQPGVSLGATWK